MTPGRATYDNLFASTFAPLCMMIVKYIQILIWYIINYLLKYSWYILLMERLLVVDMRKWHVGNRLVQELAQRLPPIPQIVLEQPI